MPGDPKGRKRPAEVIGNAIHVARIATGEITETLPASPLGALEMMGAHFWSMTPISRMSRPG
jgi:hypothetical protein